MAAPRFEWRDSQSNGNGWTIHVVFSDGSRPIQLQTTGERLRIGDIDEQCVAATNQRPILTAQQIATRTWTPDHATWNEVRKHATGKPVVFRIAGPHSEGSVKIEISKDAAGAPIFYRDVPLMPDETEKGVIKPLGASALPLIAWRLRYLGESHSRLLLEGMPTCANCHSFSADGKTLAMDLDGPQNDKGLYAIAPITQDVSIGTERVIEWSAFRKDLPGSRVGFMSQVSPDGKYVVTTVNRSDYVANFKDYRFLQVFFPTRGMLAWYSRTSGEMRLLPGADDPRYVQTSAVWSPDGKYLVFARAEARDAYPGGRAMASFANDPNETQIRYDLYRIAFNGGAGGIAEPIAGGSRNGMSNSFPKISPDGRWLVFVQARNGQLMRPDSQLYITPAAGGVARRMTCNTPLMNSWHSFSPNGRWMVFSSKSTSPYTRMFLTHIDEDGRDSPAIRIENATAANRAVNLPEFVNVEPGALTRIQVPAVEVYRRFARALELTGRREYEAAIREWKAIVELAPDDVKARNNLGFSLAQRGYLEEGLVELRKAVAMKPEYVAGHNNLALVLESLGRTDVAIRHWKIALGVNPGSGPAHNNLASALFSQGQVGEALAHWRLGLQLEPDSVPALRKASWALATVSDPTLRDDRQALIFAERAVRLSPGNDPAMLDTLAAAYAANGRFTEAVETARRALTTAAIKPDEALIDGLKARLSLYERNTAFRFSRTRPTYQK
jgi:tetratricopeptide (TPR) repeat protein